MENITLCTKALEKQNIKLILDKNTRDRMEIPLNNKTLTIWLPEDGDVEMSYRICGAVAAFEPLPEAAAENDDTPRNQRIEMCCDIWDRLYSATKEITGEENPEIVIRNIPELHTRIKTWYKIAYPQSQLPRP